MGISKIVQRAATKGANKIAKLAALSPEELNRMADIRDKYLSENPDPNDIKALELTGRLLAENSVEIYNAYLPQIDKLYSPVDSRIEYNGPVKTEHNISYIKITKWVTDKKENNLEKLVNVYAVLSREECNIALIFHRKKKKTDVYLAVMNKMNAGSNTDVSNYMNRMVAALKGNFPGAKWEDPQCGEVPCFRSDSDYSVASASNIPTEKSEKFISQTIEKLLDGNTPKKLKDEFILVLLATPIQDIDERKFRLSEMYSGLAPYAEWTTDFHFHQSDSTNSTATFGINAGVSAGIQNGKNQAQSEAHGEQNNTSNTETNQVNQTRSEQNIKTSTETKQNSRSQSKGKSKANSESFTETEGTTDSIFGSVSGSSGVEIGPIKGNVSVTGGASHAKSKSTAKTVSESITDSITDTVTQGTAHSVANTIGEVVSNGTAKSVAETIGRTVSDTLTKTNGISKAMNFGGNFGANFARSSNITATVGKDEGITQTYVNYTIKHTLEILEQQMKRCEQSVALGMWDFAAYVLSEDFNTANNVAHSYLALTQGDESYLSQASINLWRGDSDESRATKEICKYLCTLRHPVFALNPDIIETFKDYSIYPAIVTATTNLSGKELAYSLNLPGRSVVGFPVLECAEFGRNVVTYDEHDPNDEKIELGKVFHMLSVDDNVPVKLDINSLSSHTFITGSTGSGKSNTIYRIVDAVKKAGKHFLVIEPAKGEYKSVFGGDNDVHVYGTNPSISPILKINPFSFPKEIHVLEHLDRLIEIFNVCWPMYAAMPAVLKNAIEQSYVDCGWDLINSVNEYDDCFYPSFADVARNVKKIINTSEYDSENKGAYKGSLLTRLQSLSNGINGLIFADEEISASELFDENVIVDISRVGSNETKALLMGMLVLKMQEYRMANNVDFNSDLNHITVLEEAHNLLKRTSFDQSSESGNLSAKSVEMLSNAIAEMRTYGEGFIIADQAPGLLDLSVIRNTNTKIIMRLPDEDDRMVVGKSANLNDDQIQELAKLPRGVGAVYQNEWIQPVLCKVEKHDHFSPYHNVATRVESESTNIDLRLSIAEMLSKGIRIDNKSAMKDLREMMKELKLSSYVQACIIRYLSNPPKEPKMMKIASAMAELFPDCIEEIKNTYDEFGDAGDLTRCAAEELLRISNCSLEDQLKRDIIQGLVTHYLMFYKNDEQMMRKWFDIRGGFKYE